MKVLITSGGTKVPIDPVRNISNMSHGTFGSKIAAECLRLGARVIYLCADDARSPFEFRFNFYTNLSPGDARAKFHETFEFTSRHISRYEEHRFKTIVDYRVMLQSLIEEMKPDSVVLAAAVSDYEVLNRSGRKLDSKSEQSVRLTPTPKIISEVKGWHPETFLVGFKLLNECTDAELLQAAKNSIEANGCDLVVANDLASIRRGRHEILLVDPNGFTKQVDGRHNECAALVARRAVERWDGTRQQT